MRSSTLPRVLVTGAGGFIGNHLVTALKQQGYWVLIAERLCQCYTGESEVERRVLRLHKIYRPMDNRRLREMLGWEPSVTLRQGLEPTYRWIEKQVLSRRLLLAATGG
jgi:nucleoside-diphosphate-sugar epimerase